MCRAFDKNHSKDQDVFYNLNGFQTLGKIYQMLAESRGENTCVIPIKSLVRCLLSRLKRYHRH